MYNDKLNGEYTEYNNKGVPLIRGWFKKNKKDGLWSEFFENGNKKSQIEFSASTLSEKKNGHFKYWYNSGKIKSTGEYKNNLEHGTFLSWNETGSLQYEENYHLGEKDGEWKVFWKNGKLKFKDTYKNGKLISEICFDNTEKEINCYK